MGRPTSFRLPEELLVRLDEEAASAGTSVTALVSTLLDEGLRARRFPGIVYRDGPAGRRAGLVGGPDVWEIVRDLRRAPGKGEQKIKRLAADVGLPVDRVRLAVNFYATFPEEIDERIVMDERAGAGVREMVARRERLLSQ